MSFTRRPKGKKKTQNASPITWVFVSEYAEMYNEPRKEVYTYKCHIEYLLNINYVPDKTPFNQKVFQIFDKINNKYSTEGFAYAVTAFNRYEYTSFYLFLRVQWLYTKNKTFSFTGSANDLNNLSTSQLKFHILNDIERLVDFSEFTQEFFVYSFEKFFQNM